MFHSKTLCSKRLTIKTMTTLNPIWLQHRYKCDPFYRFALSNRLVPMDIDTKNAFHFVCHHCTSGDFVGSAKGYIATEKKVLWIQTFLIDRAYLRQGYGTEFFNAIIPLLASNYDIDKIILCCYCENLIGKRFWENLSFTVTKDIPVRQIKAKSFTELKDCDSNLVPYEEGTVCFYEKCLKHT